jgi:hypothetical protein
VCTAFAKREIRPLRHALLFHVCNAAAAPLKAQTRSLLGAVDHHHLLNIGQKLLKSAEVGAITQERAARCDGILLRSPSRDPTLFSHQGKRSSGAASSADDDGVEDGAAK